MYFFLENDKTAGTNKSVRFYPIDYPDELTGGIYPAPNSPYYLHTIRVEPRFQKSIDHPDIAVLHSLISSAGTFALLTAKPLPELTTMMFYFNFGSISINIEPGKSTHLDSTKFNAVEQMRSFHSMLFRDLLQTTKPFLVNDRSNRENSFFIVPVLDGSHIDWTTINAFQRITQCEPVEDEGARVQMRFQPEDYLHKVVSPWYRYDKDSRYVVLKVHTNMSPLSPFPRRQFRNYAEYMMNKYKLRTVNPNQFMIEVRGITQRLNRLSSGKCVDGSKKRAFRDAEFLIPEMCHNYGFPANLWLKASLLPSILHRVHYLLHAESLRLSINHFVGNTFGLNSRPKALLENWWDTTAAVTEPAEISTSVAVESLLADPWATLDIVETNEAIR